VPKYARAWGKNVKNCFDQMTSSVEVKTLKGHAVHRALKCVSQCGVYETSAECRFQTYKLILVTKCTSKSYSKIKIFVCTQGATCVHFKNFILE
jgi:hypothetical protein